MASVGTRIVDFYGLTPKVEYIEVLYNKYDAWAVGIAGFTPIPYKVFTIAAGAMSMALLPFTFASAVGRGARFFLVAGLIYWGGEPFERNLKRYVEVIGWIVVVIIIVAIIVLRN